MQFFILRFKLIAGNQRKKEEEKKWKWRDRFMKCIAYSYGQSIQSCNRTIQLIAATKSWGRVRSSFDLADRRGPIELQSK